VQNAVAPYLDTIRKNPIIVEGYAAGGDQANTFVVSQRRADAVRDYLIEYFQIRPTYVGVMPMGKVASEQPGVFCVTRLRTLPRRNEPGLAPCSGPLTPAIIQLMHDRWRRSRELLQRAQGSLAGGVSSPFRAKFPVPLFFQDGEGSRLIDVDGNRYIDYALAWGPLILGHKHPRMVEAVAAAALKPHAYGAQHELEYPVAEKVQAMAPCAERIAVTSAGSEAVQLAMRLARAATGRTKILKFEGHYHGWMDSALISYHPSREACGPPEAPNAALPSKGQVANAAENVVIARWNSVEALESALDAHRGEIADVILEPVLCNSGCLMPM
jgi:hypothetical protein